MIGHSFIYKTTMKHNILYDLFLILISTLDIVTHDKI